MERNIELRKLPAASLCNVVNILDKNNDWQRLMTVIPKHPKRDSFIAKYKPEHIELIQNHAKDTKRQCSEVLFDEWGTSGPKEDRPTLEILMDLLVKLHMYRAADEIARMLGEPPPLRPSTGPAADISINLTDMLAENSMEQNLDDISSIKSDYLNLSSEKNTLGNKTTRQMKEPSDLIEFSKDSIKSDMMKFSSHYSYTSADIPNINIHPASNEVTHVSSSDSSQQLPAFTQLLQGNEGFDYHTGNTTNNNTTGNTLSTESATTGSNSSNSSSVSRIQTGVSQYNIPDTYQTSVPNLEIFNMVHSEILEDKKLILFEYRELEAITNKFSENFINTPTAPVGKIGSGGFGDVYVGTHTIYGPLAVKRVRPAFLSTDFSTIMKVFNTEVKSLSHLRHRNIVPIFGYSVDGTEPCIVCEYIEGGSLQQKIAAQVLTTVQRMNIMKGTAEGLNYIHHSEKPFQIDNTGSQNVSQSSKKTYYLHGDVKSANILITKDCVPKLCDFGLAKELDTTFVMTSMIATQAYLAPEGFTGTVTQKNDIYSFGIVLLELLTGEKPIVVLGTGRKNIKNYVEDEIKVTHGDITPLLDKVVGKWNSAQHVYKLATQCIAFDKDSRPNISEVCDILREIDNN